MEAVVKRLLVDVVCGCGWWGAAVDCQTLSHKTAYNSIQTAYNIPLTAYKQHTGSIQTAYRIKSMILFFQGTPAYVL